MSKNSKRHDRKPGGVSPFWQGKTLAQMSSAEWESLCDGCARCCLVKLEDVDSGELAYTSVACRMLDSERCRCTSYANRHALVDDCVALDADVVEKLEWLPPTCAYRLVANGQDLHWWHPLVSGDPLTVHQAGISVRGRVVSEADVAPEALEDHVVVWPNEDPSE